MCGIVGFTHKNWVPDPTRIRQAIATLIHRGPDQQGVFESRVVSLGATRLKIIDLASGDQPISPKMATPSSSSTAKSTTTWSCAPNWRASAIVSTRTAIRKPCLHAFLEWDTDCFSRLRGMFAMALWTESARRLVLARDRMGIKPLYIAQRGEDLFFGSELKVDPRPSRDRTPPEHGRPRLLPVAELRALPVDADRGNQKTAARALAGVAKRQGSARAVLAAADGRRRDGHRLESAKEELDSLLQQSVREHLLSDVPLGVWLSGGIDSSTILHYAAAGLQLAAEDLLDFVSRAAASTRPPTSAKSQPSTIPSTRNST